MKFTIEELIKINLEEIHGIMVTDIKTLDGVLYEIEGVGAKGTFKTHVGLMIVEVGVSNVHNQR